MKLGDILIPESDIARAVSEIAVEIQEHYGDADLLLLGVMDGAVCFLADLMRALPRPVEMATARAASYVGTRPGEIDIAHMPPRERIEGRHVLLVEDILDTGATAATLIARLRDMGAASVAVCALLNKPSGREYDVESDFAGFDVPNVFVAGYGLDYDGAYRNLRDVWEMREGR